MYWERYPKSSPRRPADGIKAKTGRGQAFGKTWWASRWIAALEKLMDPGRLQRGRSYARGGQVLNLDISPGHVDSRVQGSRPKPYKVSIEIKPLSDHAWDKVADAMAAQAIFAAKLLAGEMPQNIEEAFTAAGESLFPGQRGDLNTDCSCPDWANPCKHIAAVYYLLGERFDEDPFLIFELRGRSKERITADLRARRTHDEAGLDQAAARPLARTLEKTAIEEIPVPLETCLESFWESGQTLERMQFTLKAPPVNAAAVKQLGPPPFWQEKDDFLGLMNQVYAAVTHDVIELAFGE